MDKLKWLDRYSGESVDQLLALENEYRIDSLVLAFEQALDQKSARQQSESLSQAETTVLAVEALEREVNNGGYSQFFINSSREYAAIMEEALHRIGCPNTAALTRAALDSLRLSNFSSDAIREAMDADDEVRDKELSRLDNLYFQGQEPIARRLFDFIKTNRTAIKL